MILRNPWVIIILVLAALLLFGGFKKLPEASRSLGRSLRIFKSETKGLVEDDASSPEASSDAPADAKSKSTSDDQSPQSSS